MIRTSVYVKDYDRYDNEVSKGLYVWIVVNGKWVRPACLCAECAGGPWFINTQFEGI